MDWYYYIALAAIASQLVFLLQTYSNYHFAVKKYSKVRSLYRPRTVLMVPCKGLDSTFQQNISSFFEQDYENYLLWFVVGDESDPVYGELCRLKNRLSQKSKARDVKVFVAGRAQTCSQKIHNLLYCYERISGDIDVLAFADSDICVQSNWLSHIVYPLRKAKYGAASGYRWFIPKKNNLASLALSAMNAKVAQLLGNLRFNQAWGGSMAIRVEVFRKLGIDKIWPKALSDDLSLSSAVKKAGLIVAFVPACLVASHEVTTWRELFKFGRRQFLITRISAPRTWWFGLGSGLYSILGLWAVAGLAVYAWVIQSKHLLLFAAVPVVFFLSQLMRAILRQKMACKLLEHERQAMKAACAADVLGFWFWTLIMLVIIISSAFGRTIRWRGIRYKMLGPNETIVVGS
ncbi:MAG: glycosyltransferase family 2 protein [Planctomycetota bacterium]|jgi:cellulose synthase/poly-beta-1,6-N-acetylglucosamine synthase-like glycosyltransferase